MHVAKRTVRKSCSRTCTGHPNVTQTGTPNRYRLVAATGVLQLPKETRTSLCKRPIPSNTLLRFPQGCADSEITEFGWIHGWLNCGNVVLLQDRPNQQPSTLRIHKLDHSQCGHLRWLLAVGLVLWID